MVQNEAPKRKEFKLLLVAAIICSVFIVGGLLFVLSVQDRSYNDSLMYINDETQKESSTIQQQFNSDLQILRGVSTSFSAIGVDNSELLQSILIDINNRNGFIRMGLASLDGTVNLVDVDGSIYEDVDFSEQAFFQQALTGQDTISEAMPSLVTGEYVNYYAVPVYDENGLAAILCAVNSATTLTDILTVPVFQGGGSFTILDNDGKIVAPTTEDGLTLENNKLLESIFTLDSSEAAAFYAALENDELSYFNMSIEADSYIAAVNPLNINDWVVVGIVPSSSINGYYQETAVGIIVIVALAGVIFLLLLILQHYLNSKNRSRLEYIAYTDLLTGLSNYTKFKIDAQNLIASNRRKRFVVWSVDLRQFKNVNNIFSYQTGNELLCSFGSALLQAVGNTSLCCRVSADNFAGISPYTGENGLAQLFDSFVAIIDKNSLIPPDQMHINLAAGFYRPDDFDDCHTIEEMVNRAEIAKQSAKNEAGNVYALFDEEMGQTVKRETELAASGVSAMEQGEIEFFLQPKVGIQGENRIVGAEVLARWNHPQYGRVSPEEFIRVFEQSGLIVQFDRYIFDKACSWYRNYLDKGFAPLNLAINVSRFGLLRGDLVQYYSSVKKKYGLDVLDTPLELEFTESTLLEDYDTFAETVKQLQDVGFTCSIDDFGSGYSSLNVLKNLPINVLKFDAVFFQSTYNKQRETIVVEELVGMMKKLSITTIAEGVEEMEQVLFLKEIGCDIIQGYIFSKPLHPDDFELLMSRTKGTLSL